MEKAGASTKSSMKLGIKSSIVEADVDWFSLDLWTGIIKPSKNQKKQIGCVYDKLGHIYHKY